MAALKSSFYFVHCCRPEINLQTQIMLDLKTLFALTILALDANDTPVAVTGSNLVLYRCPPLMMQIERRPAT